MRLLLLLILLSSCYTQAVVETYEFDNEVTRERYQQFIDELRCPKCQNQNLSGSNSPIAEDLRRELYRLLQDGQSDQQIVDFMVARYGEFILYRPRFNPETALLWMAPAVFLILGLVIIIVVFRRQRQAASVDGTEQDGQDVGLDGTERQQLQQILSTSTVTSAQSKDQSNA
ncbi:cytochrome c-type biogenesis protein [Oceanicoccus sp. KOV_DT_Chl]|uniref:cytochrome c-type biogenesis protein n=1 Tax=Oceanicoccus sp. KOV_DT_Chl TaxID=1904639 RepID=UPI000C79AFCA|nr:cytochrome c-type biogenesis protein [Oceanicoccus sp. KOV_DT_Chl]